MRKICCWSWNSLAALALLAGTAGTAQADDAVPHCLGIRPTDIQPAVQESWSTVARNAFGADGAAPEFLTVTLLIPVVRGDHPPCLAAYPADGLTRDGDDVISGWIIPTNMGVPALFQ